MSTQVKVRVGEDVVSRAIRRVHKKEDGLSYGWISVGGKDVKVVRPYRHRIWELT